MELEKPLIFIFNFGRPLSPYSLRKLADIADAHYYNYDCPFIHENPHGEQVRHTLQKAFGEIIRYAESGRNPGLAEYYEEEQ